MALFVFSIFAFCIFLGILLVFQLWKLKKVIVEKHPNAMEKTSGGYFLTPWNIKKNYTLLKSDEDIVKLVSSIKKIFIMCILLPIFSFGILIVIIILSN